MQASPSDPENFPFVVIGNKVDVDGGNSRVVSCLFESFKFALFSFPKGYDFLSVLISRY